MSTFPPFLYAIFVPVLAFLCLFPLLIVGLVGFGAWRFSRHIDGKTSKAPKFTFTGFRRPARRADPRATRLTENRARVKEYRAHKAQPAPRLAPKPTPRRINAGASHIRLVYPNPDANRYKYTEGQFSEFIHH